MADILIKGLSCDIVLKTLRNDAGGSQVQIAVPGLTETYMVGSDLEVESCLRAIAAACNASLERGVRENAILRDKVARALERHPSLFDE